MGAPFDFRLAYGRKIPRSTPVVSINRSRHELNLNRKPELGIIADPAVTIQSIANIKSKNGAGWEDWLVQLKESEKNREKEIEKQSGESKKNLNLKTSLHRVFRVGPEKQPTVASLGHLEV